MLTQQPSCICIQFEGADWQISKDLKPGVYPLKSVKRAWVLNQETQVKVSREGYTLLPDYACTAHMVQGMTLDAVIAECGTIKDSVSLKDMLAAYVALSRVRTAETLLLVRMFSRLLFQQGPPPGPYCLMQLLRDNLGDKAGVVLYELLQWTRGVSLDMPGEAPEVVARRGRAQRELAQTFFGEVARGLAALC